MPLPRLIAALLLSLMTVKLSAISSPFVRLNSVGFVTAYAKKATVVGALPNETFVVRRSADAAIVYSGTLGNSFWFSDTSETVAVADFSSFMPAGNANYYMDVPSLGSSAGFNIGPNAFNTSLWLNMAGFYNQRCGTATSMSYGGTTWGHAACHMGDGNTVNYDGNNIIKDATGGWHDAGDFNKYIINAAAAVGPMLHAWEWHSDKLIQYTLPSASNPAIPDYLEELKWELDWVKKMQFPDGKVSDKICVWGGFEPFIMPDAHLAQRYFTTWGTNDIAAFTAMCALGARVFQPYDAPYAASLLSAAGVSYAYLTTNATNVTANISGTPQGNYTGSNQANMRTWAYTEYWVTTGDPGALTRAEAGITGMGTKVQENWDWADLGTLASVSYLFSPRFTANAALVTSVRNSLKSAADSIRNRSIAATSGYGRSLNGYWWGSNGVVARHAYDLDAAYKIYGDSTYLSAIQDQLSWLYGRNYYDRSFVTGEGTNPPLYPHDRESASDGIDPPKPGHLVGGSDGCSAPCLGATKWLDEQNSANLNEIAINWDAGMTVALAALAGYPLGTPTPSPTPSFTISPTFSVSPTFTVSPTITETPTISPTYTISETPSVSPTVTLTLTVTPTPSITPTLTPTLANGLSANPAVQEWTPAPQPAVGNTLKLAVKLSGGADKLELRLYSANYARVATLPALNPPYAGGWNRATFDVSGIPKGLYFGLLYASTAGGTPERGPAQRVFLLP